MDQRQKITHPKPPPQRLATAPNANARWQQRNQRAIQVHSEVILAQGCFSDAFRVYAKPSATTVTS